MLLAERPSATSLSFHVVRSPIVSCAPVIEKQLKEGGFALEIIGVDVKSSELKSMAEKMKPLAEKMAGAAP
jgi:hypothetical protein